MRRRIRPCSTRLTAVALAAVCCCARPLPLGAHELRRGLLLFPSGSPTAGQTVDVQVVVIGSDDKPTLLINTSVWITADMTAHAMAPTVAELRTLPSPDTRAGRMRFSMPGVWRLKLEILEPDEDERVAVLPLRVWPAGATPSASALTLNFGLDVPLRPTVFDPWHVIWVAVGLIAVIEGAAIGRHIRRRVTQSRDVAPPRLRAR